MQSAKTFKCVKTAGKLVWKVTPTTTTTTTVASTTTVAVVPTVSIAATWLQGGTWPKAVSVTSNVVGTVYLVEGASPVGVVGDITKLSSQYWMSASITQTSTPTVVSVDVEALTNGYYRVYVANAVGVLSTPAVNKVTVSITRACTSNCATTTTVALTTTTVALTCALGGTCVVGDTGPGGGIVFYVASSAFTATGSTCRAGGCKYLEAAPSGWNPGADPTRTWATNVYSNQSRVVPVPGANGVAIGTGYQNSVNIVAQVGNVDESSAAVLARAYSGGSKNDWFLPSKDELNELCFYFSGVAKSGGRCNGNASTGRAGVGGFAPDNYWSSSELNADRAWAQIFVSGYQDNFAKVYTTYVRPVRSF